MLSRLAACTVLALPFLAAATPASLTKRGVPASSCSTAPIQCCESTETAGSAAGAELLDAVGVVVQDVNVLLGVTCSPISGVGVGGGSCSANPVCCSDNNFGGLLSIGCIPVDL
ncbi:unnamed protein product [Somion occarium]|uniref:Hydrophobin n=1 Tax=Somion occarium TaxID=3059160 RepID=A0ABP1CW14_9APHY